MSFHVYAIKSRFNGRIYIGQTSDLYMRLEMHNRGLVSSTRHDLPWEILACESCPTRSAARWLERQLKRSRGKRTKWIEDQIRNEGATPPEGAKRRYEAHFISKLTDCDGENSETDSSLDFARDCEYISAERHQELTGVCHEIGKMLGSMIKNFGPFLISDR